MLGIELFGYFMAIVMGVVLGLIGGGGSILTFPVLVYFFGVEPHIATSYSLFVVGITSFVGTIGYFKNKLMNWRSIIVFGIPSILSIFITKNKIYPRIPETIEFFNDFSISKNLGVTILFCILMILASYFMIKPLKIIRQDDYKGAERYRYLLIMIIGILVGFLAGLVGAGGGFLIIPALVILAKLPMKKAIGTSLVIIFLNSIIGFLGGMSQEVNIDWLLLFSLSALSIVGIIAGMYLANFVPGSKLKPAFGWFVLIIGCAILLKEFI